MNLNLAKQVLSMAKGANISALAKQFGLDDIVATTTMESILPHLTEGIESNAKSADGMAALEGALQTGTHDKYLDQPESVADEATTTDGNKILGHVLGSKDASRAAAKQVADTTGVDVGTVKKMLPVVAAMTMGGLKKLDVGSLRSMLGG